VILVQSIETDFLLIQAYILLSVIFNDCSDTVKIHESSLFQALNHFVIIAKYHIFLSWLNKASPSFKIFGLLLSEKFVVNVQLLLKIIH